MPSNRIIPVRGGIQREEDNIEISADEPKLDALRTEFQSAVGDLSMWYERQYLAEETTWCIWPGQSDDGLKWSTGDEESFPWDGSSDTRIRLVDEKVRESVRICDAAFKRGRWKASGTESTDGHWANKMTTLLQWQIRSQMRPMAERERKMALYWRNQLGLSVMGIDWERRTNTHLETVTLMTLAEYFGLAPGLQQLEENGIDVFEWMAMVAAALETEPQNLDEETVQFYTELQNAFDLLYNEEREKEMLDYMEQIFPETKRPKLRKALKELRETGESRLPQAYLVRDRARWRAMKVGDDVFFPVSTVSLEDASWVAVREWLTEAEVMDAQKTRGWSEEFCNAVIASKGKSSTHEAVSNALQDSKRWQSRRDTWESGAEDTKDLCEVFCFYYQAADEYGNLGIYKTEMSMQIGWDENDKPYGSHKLCPYEHGRMPFREQVWFREVPQLVANAGLPYLLYTYQQELKSQRDYRIDLTAISILPPMRRHPRDMNTEISLAPAGYIWETVRGSTEWMNPPNSRTGTSVELEDSVRLDADRISGGWNNKIPAPYIILKQQEMADDYLEEMTDVLTQTFQLMQQYLDEAVVTRTTGAIQQPFTVTKEEIQGAFDLSIIFDARELDTEFAEKKAKHAIEIMNLDVNQTIDRNTAVSDLLGLVDAHWRDSWIQDPQKAAQEEMEKEETNLLKIMNGFEPPMVEQGQNYRARLDYLQNAIRQNPRVMQAMQNDDTVAQLIDTRMQHLNFMVEQQTTNKQAGYVGAKPVYGN